MATNAWDDGYGRAGGVGQFNYFQANPDVGNEYQKVLAAGGQVSPEDYALWHFDNYGQYEGRQGVLPTGQNQFERMQGVGAGTFYDQYAGEQQGVGSYGALSPNPTKGIANQNLAKYQAGFGDQYNKSLGGLRGWAGGLGNATSSPGTTTTAVNGTQTQNNPNGALVDALRQKPARYQGLGMGLATNATNPQAKNLDLSKNNMPSGLFQSI